MRQRSAQEEKWSMSADADREWTFRPLKTAKKRSIDPLKTYVDE